LIELSGELYEAGFTTLTNIDISDVCIDKMRERYPEATYPGMIWSTMDARHMTLPANSFDIILEKGTIDALSCDKGEDIPVGEILASCWK
jgi:ubiquinone/menaquinone biosynthesis C-methylase UbiE